MVPILDKNSTDSLSFHNPSRSLDSEPFEWKEVIRAFCDPQVWLIGFAGTAQAVGIFSLGFFLYVTRAFSSKIFYESFRIVFPEELMD